MGCKNSLVKGDGSPENAADLPPVPPDSWYAQKFTEPATMTMSEYQQRNKGKVLMATHLMPSSSQQVETFPNSEVSTSTSFTLGKDIIYGMGYFHNTALFIEHHWRPRVAFQPQITNRFERPFYNMLIGIKVLVDGKLVPDCHPFDNSLPSCTSTIRASEATTTWLCVPLVLCGDPAHRILSKVHLYRGLMASFLTYAKELSVGEHNVRVDAVYGCKDENNFVTDFIAFGTFTLVVTEESKALVAPYLEGVQRLMTQSGEKPPTYVENTGNSSTQTCSHCSKPKRYVCTTCGAGVCGSPQCVWSIVNGYPTGCRSHKTVLVTA